MLRWLQKDKTKGKRGTICPLRAFASRGGATSKQTEKESGGYGFGLDALIVKSQDHICLLDAQLCKTWCVSTTQNANQEGVQRCWNERLLWARVSNIRSSWAVNVIQDARYAWKAATLLKPYWVSACLHGVSGDQRLVVDGSGSLCCQLGGEVAVGSRKTLIVVVWDIVLTCETALCGWGSYLWAQCCWDREGVEQIHSKQKQHPRFSFWSTIRFSKEMCGLTSFRSLWGTGHGIRWPLLGGADVAGRGRPSQSFRKGRLDSGCGHWSSEWAEDGWLFHHDALMLLRGRRPNRQDCLPW